MNIIRIIDAFGYIIYLALAFLAVWGVYNGILLYRTLSKKTLRDPEPLIGQVQELCQARKFDAAVSVCQSPAYWHKALAQLIAVALRNREKGLAKIKQLLVTEFHTEVIAGMENRLASIATIVRMGPLLGLLGTVASMIAAFNRIGGAEQVNPRALASDISLALWAEVGPALDPAGRAIVDAWMVLEIALELGPTSHQEGDAVMSAGKNQGGGPRLQPGQAVTT